MRKGWSLVDRKLRVDGLKNGVQGFGNLWKQSEVSGPPCPERWQVRGTVDM